MCSGPAVGSLGFSGHCKLTRVAEADSEAGGFDPGSGEGTPWQGELVSPNGLGFPLSAVDTILKKGRR